MKIGKREAAKQFKCCCCGEIVRKCEQYVQVMNGDKPVRGERYCVDCEPYAYQNNQDVKFAIVDDDGEHHLRQMENYAAYSAAGCPSAYWDDQAAGYVE